MESIAALSHRALPGLLGTKIEFSRRCDWWQIQADDWTTGGLVTQHAIIYGRHVSKGRT